MSHRSYPKEREKKLKDTIKKLKAEMNQLEKEIKFLKHELEGRIPLRKEKSKVELTHEEWRQDFLKRYKKEVFNKD